MHLDYILLCSNSNSLMLTKLFTKIKQKDLCTIIPLINFQAKETKPAVKKKNYIFLNHINKYSKRRLEDKIELNKQTNKISVKKKTTQKIFLSR